MASLKEIEEAKLAAKALNEELGYLEDAFTSIGQKIKDNITGQLEGADKQTQELGNKFATNLNKAINENARALKEITKLQDQIGKGVNVEAKIQKQLADVATRKKTIARQQNILLANGIKLNEENSKQLSSQFSIQEDTLNTLTKENTERQKQKSLFTILGEGGKNLVDKLDKSGTASKLLGGNLKDTVTTTRLMEGAVGLIIDSFFALDKTTAEVAETLGISFHEAQGMNKEFSRIAQNSNNIFVTTQSTAKSQMELSKILGTNAMFTDEMLQTQTELTHQLGLSAETSGEIAKLGLLTGKTSKEIATNVLGQSAAMNAANGTAITEKAILQEVAKLSSSIQLSMANNPVALAEAVQTAKQFGMELSAVDGIAGSLLNFESSIGAELEAELLLGKDINLEKARQFALNNDLAGVAREIAKQAGTAAEFTAMNRIQQEALAKAVGMSREDLAKTLQDQEILSKLGGKDKDTKAAYNRLVSEGLSQEQIAATLGDKKLADAMHAESIQDRFNAALKKAQELFVQIADAMMPIVEPIIDLVGYMASLVSKSMGFLKVLGGIYAISKSMSVLRKVNVGLAKADLALQEKNLLVNNALAAAEIRKNIAKELGMGIGAQTLAVMGLQTAALEYQVARESGKNVIQSLGLAIASQILGVKTLQGIQDTYALEREGGKNVLAAIGVVLAQTKLGATIAEGFATMKNLGKKAIELAMETGIAAAKILGVSASTLGIGTAIALAAAAAGIAYLYSVSKGNDVMSAGSNMSGYGSRTLMGPEGAIALNNKDTVIAGTNLFPKGDDVVSGPAGSVNMAPDNSRMEKLLERAINRPDPVIKMNGDKLGTAVGKYSYSTQ